MKHDAKVIGFLPLATDTSASTFFMQLLGFYSMQVKPYILLLY